MSDPTIGVLALQGDVREHLTALTRCGASVRAVRRPDELDGLAGIVLPGGESTTIDKLSRIFEVRDPLVAALRAGLPAYGSCAGMILLADRVIDGTSDQQTFGGLDITVRRNAFGRQTQSFEADVTIDHIDGGTLHAVFIRAPWVEQVGTGVEVIGTVDLPRDANTGGEQISGGQISGGQGGSDGPKIIAVQQGLVLATSFHPEVTNDLRIHSYFVDLVRGS